MQRFQKILSVCIFFICSLQVALAQRTSDIEHRGLSQFCRITTDTIQLPLIASFQHSSLKPINRLVIASDLYVNSLEFFCRYEYKLEKRSGIPLRIRIGSLEQSRKLEGYRY